MQGEKREPVVFDRDTVVVMIPDGFEHTVPAGTRGTIHQLLGGNYTIQTDRGALVRLPASEADAIGHAPQAFDAALRLDAGAPVAERAWTVLATVYDPEIPVDIVELGLVYDVLVRPDGAAGDVVTVQMTLTAPGCGMGEILMHEVEERVGALEGVARAEVALVFDPPWSVAMMSDTAKLQLGMD